MIRRRLLVLSMLTAAIMVCSALSGVQQASALSVGESLSYTLQEPLPTPQEVWYYAFNTLGVVSTTDGPAYAVVGRTDHYSVSDPTHLLQRDLSFHLISVSKSKLLFQSIDWRWYDESGSVKQHRLTSVKFNYAGKTTVIDCIAYILPPETPQLVTAHLVVARADLISTQRVAYDYNFYSGQYKVGESYSFYTVWWKNDAKTWFLSHDDVKLVETTFKTVPAGRFLSYHFVRTTPWTPNFWGQFSDAYVMVDSRVIVCEEDSNTGEQYALTGYYTGIG
jgi:hypothetical protein